MIKSKLAAKFPHSEAGMETLFSVVSMKKVQNGKTPFLAHFSLLDDMAVDKKLQ